MARGFDANAAAQAAARRKRRATAATIPPAPPPGQQSMVLPIVNSWYPEPGVSPGPGGLPSTPLVAALTGANDPPIVPPSTEATSTPTIGGLGGFPASSPSPSFALNTPAIQRDHASIMVMARAYERMARDGIKRLDNERPNQAEAIERNAREREMLSILAEGFAQIAAALEAFAKDPSQPVFLGRAQAAVNWVSEQLTLWLKANGQEAIGWAIKIPVFAASLPLLGWGGADMTYATIAMGAMLGGADVAVALAGRRKKSKPKK
jgi:hypothetical protein